MTTEQNNRRNAINAVLAVAMPNISETARKNPNLMGKVTKAAWEGKSAEEIAAMVKDLEPNTPAFVYSNTQVAKPKRSQEEIDAAIAAGKKRQAEVGETLRSATAKIPYEIRVNPAVMGTLSALAYVNGTTEEDLVALAEAINEDPAFSSEEIPEAVTA